MTIQSTTEPFTLNEHDPAPFRLYWISDNEQASMFWGGFHTYEDAEAYIETARAQFNAQCGETELQDCGMFSVEECECPEE